MPDNLLQNKRIMIQLGWLGMGGAERQALLLAEHLVKEQGAVVEFWAYTEPGLAARECERLGIEWRIVHWPWRRNPIKAPLRYLRFLWWMRQAHFDVLMPYTTYPSIFCGIGWKLTGAKACFWNLRDEGRDITGRWNERLSIRNASHLVSNSAHAAAMLKKKFHPKKPIHVILNGVHLAAPKKTRWEWRRELGVDDDTFLAVMVANLHEHKDQATLVRAWKIVSEAARAKGQKVTLVLAGETLDAAGSAVHDLIAQLDLGVTVLTPGKISDIPGLLEAVDLCTFSSQREGVPNGILECMARGLPVVATDIPGIREALGDDYPFLAPITDAETFAKHVLTLLDDAPKRQQLGETNKARVEKVFSTQRMCREYVDILNAILAK